MIKRLINTALDPLKVQRFADSKKARTKGGKPDGYDHQVKAELLNNANEVIETSAHLLLEDLKRKLNDPTGYTPEVGGLSSPDALEACKLIKGYDIGGSLTLNEGAKLRRAILGDIKSGKDLTPDLVVKETAQIFRRRGAEK